ncbi:MAG TPA: nuclease A inhibitor family protein [Gemmatimonas sp.]|nr:nuclease A inhibitor family protein [Gemmatimonas sp.]
MSLDGDPPSHVRVDHPSSRPIDHRDAVLRELEALADGLVYSSEGDHPFVVVHLADGAPGTPLSDERLRRLLGLADATVMHRVTIDRILGRHTVLTQPTDERAQAVRPRYEAMQRYLESSLRNIVAVRTGESPAIDVWLLGHTGDGELVGYHTRAIET